MSEWKSGQIILGEYTIEKELGRGGMGCVWLVRSNSTNHRFAVKQTLLKEEKHRKAFLAELQTWIDLPDHPNIVPCRFFRTVGDDIVIFADFIEGGSLADWIAKGKLTSLEQILDVAIQFAWGLHAIHERGLIHQDVKPGNVLMTLEGVPMITDFGLARARLRVADGSFVSPALPPGEDSVLVSVGGMTPAYASPEQRAGQPLSRKTDIWSWGVSVLDMFMGGVSCPHGGQIAADVLEALRENAQEDFGLLKMPGAIADILEKCFHKDPSERLMSLMIAADTVSLTYKAYTGDVYKHPKPAISARAQKQRDHKRMVHGVAYRDPAEWKQEFLPYMPMVSTQKADESSCFLDDLALFEELDLLLFKVTEKAHSRLHIRHASLLLDKGLVHRAHNDTSGEMQCYTRAIAYLESETIAGGEQSSDIRWTLSNALSRLASILFETGDRIGAARLFARACGEYDHLWKIEPTSSTAISLALAWQNVGACSQSQEEGIAAYSRAIGMATAMLRDTAFVGGEQWDALDILGTASRNMAQVLSFCGKHEDAIRCLDAASAIYCGIIDNSYATFQFTTVVGLKADILASLGRLVEAISLYEISVNGLRTIVKVTPGQYGRELARVLLRAGYVLADCGYKEAALASRRESAEMYDALVDRHGRYDLAYEMANSHTDYALMLEKVDACAALVEYRKAVDVFTNLLKTSADSDVRGDCGRALCCMADIYLFLNESEQAREAVERGLDMLSEAAKQNDRFQSALEWVRNDLCNRLGTGDA